MLKKQLTKQEAIDLYHSNFWEKMNYKDRALFQLINDRLCMPFDVFHEAIRKALNRPVWTHEMALNRQELINELLGKKSAPSFEEIINLIPKEKRIIIQIQNE